MSYLLGVFCGLGAIYCAVLFLISVIVFLVETVEGDRFLTRDLPHPVWIAVQSAGIGALCLWSAFYQFGVPNG